LVWCGYCRCAASSFSAAVADAYSSMKYSTVSRFQSVYYSWMMSQMNPLCSSPSQLFLISKKENKLLCFSKFPKYDCLLVVAEVTEGARNCCWDIKLNLLALELLLLLFPLLFFYVAWCSDLSSYVSLVFSLKLLDRLQDNCSFLWELLLWTSRDLLTSCWMLMLGCWRDALILRRKRKRVIDRY